MDSKEREHLIVLKVMRLTKPTLMLGQPLPALPLTSPSGQETTVNLSDQLELVEGFKNFSLGEMLTLPQTFGNIFLGETFSSYISVHNDSDQLCKDIQIKADLQTSSQRMTLLGTNAANFPELKPDDSIDDVIHHEVKELGTHILVCAVNYTTSQGEKMYFRKFFKFQVLKPLDVKTKFHNADSDDVYLEAQIQNITPVPVFMENVTLDPSPEYTAINLHKHSDQPTQDTKKSNVFQRIDYMNPLDIRQYLYCLKPKPDISTKRLRNVTHVGKLDIVWKTNMGEKARLQTSALQRLVPSTEDIHLKVEQLPEAVQTEEPFELVLKATNCSERTMEVDLHLDNTVESGVLWCGVSGQHLGCLKPGHSTSLSLPLVAISTGLLTIAGLKLTDTFLKRTYEYRDLAQIFSYCT